MDAIIHQYGKRWLKLRWPGPRGGFAGYIDMSSACTHVSARRGGNVCTVVPERKRVVVEEKCIGGEYYPSSEMMELLGMYDDGLELLEKIRDEDEEGVGTDVEDEDEHDQQQRQEQGVSKVKEVMGNEPVFCRICREGIHDMEYTAAAAAAPDGGGNQNLLQENESMHGVQPNAAMSSSGVVSNDVNASSVDPAKQAMILREQFQTHPSAENPMLAPCECSGSMAFVHRLCIEEWRCRSRHPAARNGLNCETCNAEYTLPPPPIRPHDGNENAAGERVVFAEDDWVDAMPAHVLAALRRPHPWWRFCATVVRRKWLRPIAPIICSPIVATYCRCRRMLKKRGVSRRRWACSLCRRRARWKCVRCLRSYYCSRQCQNVSWHIMHKHMCYKPVRIWWSAVCYGLLTIVLVPGIWQNPLVYWTSLTNVAMGFLVSSNLAGSLAIILKKLFRIDLRGRFLELFAVILTLLLGYIKWGLIWGFFGEPQGCIGIFWNSFHDIEFFQVCLGMRTEFLHEFLALVLKKFDEFVIRWAYDLQSLCTKSLYEESNGMKCFLAPHVVDPYYLLAPENESCRSDMNSMIIIQVFTLLMMFVSFVLKKTDRRVRAVGGRRVGARPHLD